jgi:hypothetical protein
MLRRSVTHIPFLAFRFSIAVEQQRDIELSHMKVAPVSVARRVHSAAI